MLAPSKVFVIQTKSKREGTSQNDRSVAISGHPKSTLTMMVTGSVGTFFLLPYPYGGKRIEDSKPGQGQEEAGTAA